VPLLIMLTHCWFYFHLVIIDGDGDYDCDHSSSGNTQSAHMLICTCASRRPHLNIAYRPDWVELSIARQSRAAEVAWASLLVCMERDGAYCRSVNTSASTSRALSMPYAMPWQSTNTVQAGRAGHNKNKPSLVYLIGSFSIFNSNKDLSIHIAPTFHAGTRNLLHRSEYIPTYFV
jgi:hypothetical protein